MFKLGREGVAAGAYNQRANTVASSFTGLSVSSDATIAGLTGQSLTALRDLRVSASTSLNLLQVSSNFIGHAAIRGLANITSGTTVVSISATGVVSGDVIIATPYMYADAQTTVTSGSQFFVGITVASVRTGAFEIFAIGSRAPIANCPVAWWKVA